MRKYPSIFFTLLLPLFFSAQSYKARQSIENSSSFVTEPQNIFQIRQITTQQGLSSNEVYSIYQDKYGLMWLANGRALSAYDGKTFKTFFKNIDLAPENNIIETSNGIKYNYSYGIIESDYFDLKIIPLDSSKLLTYFPDKGAYKQSRIFMDKTGMTFVYRAPQNKVLNDTVFYSLDKRNFQTLILNTTKGDSIEVIPRIDNQNTFWIQFNYTRTFGDKRKKCFSLSYYENSKLIPFIKDMFIEEGKNSPYNAVSIFKASDGSLYFVEKNNLCRISPDKKIIPIAIDYGYTPVSTPKIFEDKAKSIWIPYFNGLIKIHNDNVEYIKNGSRVLTKDLIKEYDPNGKAHETLRYDESYYSTFSLGDEFIITGNEIYDGREFTKISTGEDNYVTGCFIDRENQAWILTLKGVFVAKKLNIKALNTRGAIRFVSEDGKIILSSLSKQNFKEAIFLYINNKIKDSIEVVSSDGYDDGFKIFRAKNKIVIIEKNNFYQVEGDKISLKKFDLRFDQTPIAVNNKGLRGLYTDSKGNFWGVTKEKYLFRYDGTKMELYGKESGINDTVKAYFDFRGIKTMDYIFAEHCIFYFENNKFSVVKNSNIISPDQEIIPITIKNNAFYFCGPIFEKTKKFKAFRIKKNSLEEFKIIDQNNSLMSKNAPCYVEFGKNTLSFNINRGISVQSLDDEHKTIINKGLKLNPAYIPVFPSLFYLNKKLIVFNDAGPLYIYDVNNDGIDSLPDPLGIPSLSHFIFKAWTDSLGNAYGTNIENNSFMVKTQSSFKNLFAPITKFMKVTFTNDSLTTLTDLTNKFEIPYSFNPLKIFYKAVCLSEGRDLEYKYKLVGIDKNWNQTKEDNLIYTSLPSGSYTFQVKACNNNGIWNETPAEFSFTILPPWYRTWYAYSSYILIGIFTIRGYTRSRTKKLEKEKEKLEKTVEERTAEVVQQKHLLEEKNKEIIDSITYARRIQRSLLPTEKYIERVLNKDKDKQS
jgi:hypothetical protein